MTAAAITIHGSFRFGPRALGLLGACLAHVVLAAVFLVLATTPHSVRPPAAEPVSVVFVEPVIDAQPEPAAAPRPVEIPPPPVAQARPDTPPVTAAAAPEAAPDAVPPAPVSSEAPQVLATTGADPAAERAPEAGAFVWPEPAASGGALRSLACAQGLGRDALEACGEAGGAFDYAGLDPQAVEQVAAFEQSRLAGLGFVSIWASGGRFEGANGAQTLAPPARNLSAADGMRDRLPPMVPDPAFGD
ncbi:MAG: hypothetical protein ABL308_11055 [Oceanicaulis sp.]